MFKLFITIITFGIFWKPPSMAYMLERAKSPDKIEYYLSCFWTKSDKGDPNNYWKSPEEFMRDSGGDCEDFAIVAYELLKNIGYKPEIYSLWNPNDNRAGHAICVFETGYFSNNVYYKKTFFQIGNSTEPYKPLIIEYMENKNYTEYKRYNWKVRRRYIREKHNK